MLQADKSVSTTRWPRRASSVIAVDLPVRTSRDQDLGHPEQPTQTAI